MRLLLQEAEKGEDGEMVTYKPFREGMAFEVARCQARSYAWYRT